MGHFASLSQNDLIFRVPKRSIHEVCEHRSAENQDSLTKIVEMGHFASLSQNDLIFRAPKRSIHEVCEHRSAENQDSLTKIVEMETAPNLIEKIYGPAYKNELLETTRKIRQNIHKS